MERKDKDSVVQLLEAEVRVCVLLSYVWNQCLIWIHVSGCSSLSFKIEELA